MNIELKNKIDKLRKEGLSYANISHKLSTKGITLSLNQVRAYHLTRVPVKKLTPRRQCILLDENIDYIVSLLRSGKSIKEVYNKIGLLESTRDIEYKVFIQWVNSIGGLAVIKSNKHSPGSIKHTTNVYFTYFLN